MTCRLRQQKRIEPFEYRILVSSESGSHFHWSNVEPLGNLARRPFLCAIDSTTGRPATKSSRGLFGPYQHAWNLGLILEIQLRTRHSTVRFGCAFAGMCAGTWLLNPTSWHTLIPFNSLVPSHSLQYWTTNITRLVRIRWEPHDTILLVQLSIRVDQRSQPQAVKARSIPDKIVGTPFRIFPSPPL